MCCGLDHESGPCLQEMMVPSAEFYTLVDIDAGGTMPGTDGVTVFPYIVCHSGLPLLCWSVFLLGYSLKG